MGDRLAEVLSIRDLQLSASHVHRAQNVTFFSVAVGSGDHEALASDSLGRVEEATLQGDSITGGTADIFKCFDQVLRKLVCFPSSVAQRTRYAPIPTI